MPRLLSGELPAQSTSHLVAALGDRDLEPDRLLVAVGVDLVGVDAVRQRGDRLAHGPLRAADDLVGQRFERVQPELVHELEQPRGADVVAGGLGVDVAEDRLRRADVGGEDLEQLAGSARRAS